MGLRASYLQFIESAIDNRYPDSKIGLSMLELGNQHIKKKTGYSERTGKELFTNKGFQHTSVDLNGLDGSLIKDLRDPEDFIEWHEHFDIITNSGTTEHVEPFESQYICFNILHDILKTNGIVVHLIPDYHELKETGAWNNHCHNYYTSDFFKTLCEKCSYTLIEDKVIDGLRATVYCKNEGSTYSITKEEFYENIFWVE